MVKLNNIIKTSFRKIRIGKQKINPALEKLFQQNEFLMESLYKLEQNDDLTGAEEIAKNLL